MVTRTRSTRAAPTAGGGCGSRSRSTSALLAVEVVGGILTDSLAVLADAGHLLSDAGSIGLALFAAALASRPGGAPAHLRLPALRGARGARQRAAAGRRRDRRSRSPPSAASATRPAIDGGGVLALGAPRPRRQRRRHRRARPRRARGPQPRGRAAPQPSPTRSARSASSSPAPSSCSAARRSSTRSSAC